MKDEFNPGSEENSTIMVKVDYEIDKLNDKFIDLSK
jgi:hypothetical protein